MNEVTYLHPLSYILLAQTNSENDMLITKNRAVDAWNFEYVHLMSAPFLRANRDGDTERNLIRLFNSKLY